MAGRSYDVWKQTASIPTHTRTHARTQSRALHQIICKLIVTIEQRAHLGPHARRCVAYSARADPPRFQPREISSIFHPLSMEAARTLSQFILSPRFRFAGAPLSTFSPSLCLYPSLSLFPLSLSLFPLKRYLLDKF